LAGLFTLEHIYREDAQGKGREDHHIKKALPDGRAFMYIFSCKSVFTLQEPKSKKHIEQSQTCGTEEHARQEFLSGGEEQHGDCDQEVDHEEEDKGVYSLVHLVYLYVKIHISPEKT
jgi:hypothetical protein